MVHLPHVRLRSRPVDSIEGVTHSLCDLAYEDHRPLYDWFLQELGIFHTRQIEFARLNITYTILSKRYLKQLVDGGYVRGWDDPRMPTLVGMRRRGYPAEAVRNFIDQVGVAKKENLVEFSLLEFNVRDSLNRTAPRVMGVLNPVKVVITNYPDGQVEELDAVNNPEDPSAGTRKLPFSKVLYIDQDDFREVPPPKYFRLAPGREVRLRYGYYIQCQDYVKNEQTGEIEEIHCTYDPQTRGGYAPDGRKVQGTIHWVAADTALDAEVRLYDRLFTLLNPNKLEENESFLDYLNPNSLKVLTTCKIEPSLAGAAPGTQYQFERKGFFTVDLDFNPRSPGLQPDRHPARHLGQDRRPKSRQSQSPALTSPLFQTPLSGGPSPVRLFFSSSAPFPSGIDRRACRARVGVRFPAG